MNSFKHKIDKSIVQNSLISYTLRIVITDILFFVIAYSNGLFDSTTLKITMGTMIFVFFGISVYMLFKEYRNRFLSIEFNGILFKINYFSFFKLKQIETANISANTSFFVNNYSRKSFESTRINLEFKERKMSFFLPLEDVLKILFIIKTNGGDFQKDFDLKCLLKEIRTLKTYEDLYLVIDTLLE